MARCGLGDLKPSRELRRQSISPNGLTAGGSGCDPGVNRHSLIRACWRNLCEYNYYYDSQLTNLPTFAAPCPVDDEAIGRTAFPLRTVALQLLSQPERSCWLHMPLQGHVGSHS